MPFFVVISCSNTRPSALETLKTMKKEGGVGRMDKQRNPPQEMAAPPCNAAARAALHAERKRQPTSMHKLEHRWRRVHVDMDNFDSAKFLAQQPRRKPAAQDSTRSLQQAELPQAQHGHALLVDNLSETLLFSPSRCWQHLSEAQGKPSSFSKQPRVLGPKPSKAAKREEPACKATETWRDGFRNHPPTI